MLNRLVKILHPLNENNESTLKPFKDILSTPNIVLLGEPGSGKSYLFDKASQYEKGKLISAGNFPTYADKFYTDKPVYIDALDEKRARTEQSNSINDIIQSILKVKPSKLRLSCRAADWLGETDLSTFKPYFEAQGGYCVVALEDLSDEEINSILEKKGVMQPNEFRDKAIEKGLSSMLTNPQTLIMLADSTKNGQFPKSKKELYENATDVLLTEHNEIHQHKALLGHPLHELRDAAGLVCAALLIADVDGISLLNSTPNAYTTLLYPNPEVVLAALSKRAFSMQDQNQELVNCVHRTVAEYLGACYLVKLIRDGLSIGRVRSWLEIEGCPASELRGLYAWLTQLLTEHTNVLLKSDPYGILVYGDISCLPPSNRKALFQALINLAEKDPWFRAQDWSSASLGALSTTDMANDFKSILSTQREQFHLCSLVLDAIKHGEPQPELESILLEIFCDEQRYYAERRRAFECLLHAVPNGKNLAVKATKEQLEISADSLRLKAGVLAEFYQNNFNVHDVIQFINDYSQFNSKQISSGDLWYIGESLPIEELIKILDSLAIIELNKRNEAIYEVSGFFSDVLARVLNYITTIEPERLWLWLSGVQKYKDPSYNYHHQKDDPVRNWLLKNKPYVFQMFENTLADASINELCTLLPFWQNFQNTVRYVLDDSEIIPIAFSFIEKKEKINDKERAIFKLIFCLTIDLNPPDIELFNQLKNYGDLHPELAEILKYNCFCTIDDWRHDDRIRKIENKQKLEETQYKNRCDFKRDLGLIRTAQHLNWLDRLANVYFAKFSGIDNTQTPKERLAEQLGEENVEAALEGLCAIINRDELPTPIKVATQYLQNTGATWWRAILAGITETYHVSPDLTTYSEPLLRSSLAINFLYPSFYLQEEHGTRQFQPTWQQDLFQFKPSLVQSVYLEIIEAQIQAKKGSIQGLREICEAPELKSNRAGIVLKLLADYPNILEQELRTLLLTAITFPEQKIEFIKLVESALKPRARVRLNRRELWLSAGFIISFETFKDRITKCIAKHNSVIWTLISIVESVRLEGDKMQALELSIAQRVFLIHLVGEYFPDIERPDGTLIGNQNPWDAAKFVQGQITTLSTLINSEASTALTRLIKEPKLSSYLYYFKHAAANQAALRRKESFNQLNWQQTVEALSSGKPAHIADLYALTIENLHDTCKQIRDGNTDIFKSFWNEDPYGRITEPKNEESCRDRLIELLKPHFIPLGINVEPEVHMASDKRADIVLLNSARQKLPIEIKRDYHKDLWTACENQLDRLYAHDPQASGYGIYLVFWFGDKRTKKIKKPPKSIADPKTAQELEIALQSLIKDEDKGRLAVVVIDVTRPGE